MTAEYLTVRQIAHEADVTDRTVRRWLDEEGIPVLVRGNDRRMYIDRADIEHHLIRRVAVRRRSPVASEVRS
jgi:excisionase family DNA binding protein